MTTYWKPIGANEAVKLFGDFKVFYDYPLFLKIKKNGDPDKRIILAIGMDDIPPGGVIGNTLPSGGR